VRERLQRIEALHDIAVHLAVEGEIEAAQHVIFRHVELGEIVIGEVVLRRRGFAPHGLQEAHHELLIVLPVARLAGPQRFEAARRHIGCEVWFALLRYRKIAGDQIGH
jgi:hypothetical protein